MATITKTKHKTGTREEWLKARLVLLKAEKELTHKSDELTKQRMELPWVKINKDYRFDTEMGKATLADLFQGRSQLLVYHFMFGPEYKAGCPSCSSIADSFNGICTHLANHDVMFWAISRGPLAKLEAYKKRMGWSFPWASSLGSDFNLDFSVHTPEEQQRRGESTYNFTQGSMKSSKDIDPNTTASKEVKAIAATTGTDWATYIREMPGMSAFALEDGVVYHTYSAYARGLDVLWNQYQWLDRAPKGRNESDYWVRRHDEYGKD